MNNDTALKLYRYFDKYTDEIKLQIVYRYISLLCTTLIYILGNDSRASFRKIFVISCITLSTILLSYLYIRVKDSKPKIILLAVIETIGTSFILIPSGGLESPYVWYALNTILVCAIDLGKSYCWINMTYYLVLSGFVNSRLLTFETLIMKERNLILSFVLITAIIQLLAKYIKGIQHNNRNIAAANDALMEANMKVKETMSYIMELYQAVHLFSEKRDKNGLVELIIEYTKKITKSSQVMFYICLKSGNALVWDGKGFGAEKHSQLEECLLDIHANSDSLDKPMELDIGNSKYILATVKSTHKFYGILGIESSSKDAREQMKFLSELSSIVFEKAELEDIKEHLIITDEQNRIANEIHDSVLQKLFGISCRMFAMIKQNSEVTVKDLSEELGMIRSSLDSAMRDLRATIYGLSSQMNGINTFEADLRNYINEIQLLNHVEINFGITGNQELLSNNHKKALYRIICEGIGNAVRHGKADKITVKLEIEANTSKLIIMDNGRGFPIEQMQSQGHKGLGIQNINTLVGILKGNVTINSSVGNGTTITAMFPSCSNAGYLEEAI